MIKLSKEGMSKTEKGQKWGLFHVGQVVSAKEPFLEKIKSATPGSIQTIRVKELDYK